MSKKPDILIQFFRYNAVALIATTVDFIAFVLLNNIVNLWYLFSTLLSAVIGGITAFILNRIWVFKSINNKVSNQAIKYILVWSGSIFLNTYGLYLLVENSDFNEVMSKLFVSISIGVTYNFLMSRLYIFK